MTRTTVAGAPPQESKTERADILVRRCETYLAQATPLTHSVNGLLAETANQLGIDGAFALYVSAEGAIQLPFRTGFESLSADDILDWNRAHIQSVRLAMASDEIVVLQSPADSVLPAQTVAIARYSNDGAPFGVVEIVVPTRDESKVAASGEFIKVLCDCIGRIVFEYKRFSAEPTRFWRRFDRFILEIQKGLDPRRVAIAVCHDGAALLDVDRVTLVAKSGYGTKVLAISGQHTVQHRSRIVKAQERLANLVIKSRQPITFTGQDTDFSRPVEEALAEYLTECGSRMLLARPLFRTPRVDMYNDEVATGLPEPIACLLVEQFSESRPKPRLEPRIELLTAHISNALTNALDHEGLFLMPLWRRLGQVANWFSRIRFGWAAFILFCILVAVAAMAWLPLTYHVWAKGRAMPALRATAFAPIDSEVSEILVEDGDRVVAGQILVRLVSDKLQSQLVNKESEIRELRKQIVVLRTRLEKANDSNSRDEAFQVEGELSRRGIELEGAESELTLIRNEIEALNISVPIDGIVATFELRKRLANRPVNRGEVLLEVMHDRGEWQLDLNVPGHKMGHLNQAMKTNKFLPVTFVLANAVEKTRFGTVSTVGTRLETKPSEGAIVRIIAVVDGPLADQRVGTEVTAKIDCGHRSALYVLFGDTYDFFRRRFWW